MAHVSLTLAHVRVHVCMCAILSIVRVVQVRGNTTIDEAVTAFVNERATSFVVVNRRKVRKEKSTAWYTHSCHAGVLSIPQ